VSRSLNEPRTLKLMIRSRSSRNLLRATLDVVPWIVLLAGGMP
jgi:hypothetical protein